MEHRSLKNQLIATSALAAALITGYARRAYAAPQCNYLGGRHYLCDTTFNNPLFFNGSAIENTVVYGAPGFNVYTNSGSAITLINQGHIAFSDTSGGNIKSYSGDGINASVGGGVNGYGGIDITTNSYIYGYKYGLLARSVSGTYDINISTYGNVTGNRTGIYAGSFSGGNISITTGLNSVINANSGPGYGIKAYTSASGNMDIRVYGDINAHSDAIFAYGYPSDDIKIYTGEDSTLFSASRYGIHVVKRDYDGNIQVTASGDIFSDRDSIRINNYSSVNDINVTLGSNAYLRSYSGAGIEIDSNGGPIRINLKNSEIHAAHDGIYVSNNYNGLNPGSNIAIESGRYSVITSDNSNSVTAINAGGDISINMNGQVFSQKTGIYANTSNGGEIAITTGRYGLIKARTYDGIRSYISYGKNNYINTDGLIRAGTNAIYAYNYHSRSIHINLGLYSQLVAYGKNGILAKEYNSDGDIVINVDGRIMAQEAGISASSERGTGNIAVHTGYYSYIRTYNNSGINIHNANYDGNSQATIEGTIVASKHGVDIRNEKQAHDITILASDHSDITAESANGISAYNSSDSGGATNIQANGRIIAYQHGIYATNGSHAGDINISTGSDSYILSNQYWGISAYSHSTSGGNIWITMNGDLYASRQGIYARNVSYSGSIRVDTDKYSNIHGQTGIHIRANDGNVIVDAGGHITSAYDSIYISTQNDADDIHLTTGIDSNIVSNNGNGINVQNYSNTGGSTYLEVDGNVSVNIHGIRAVNDRYATNLYLSVLGDVFGTNSGAVVSNGGTGYTYITVSGSLTGIGAYGLYVAHFGADPLTITNHGQISGKYGLSVRNKGAVAGHVFTDGTIEGTGGRAFFFYNDSTSKTTLEIGGGRIIGNVVDYYTQYKNSFVDVTGNFSSEGNFKVFHMNIDTSGDFTLNADNYLDIASELNVYGQLTVAGTNTNIYGSLYTQSGGKFFVNEDANVSGYFYNNGTTSIATGKTLTVNTMGGTGPGYTGYLNFGFDSVANHAQMIVTSGAANLTNQTLYINVAGVTGLANNEQALLITGAADIIGGPGGVRTQVGDSSVMWDFDIVDGTNSITHTSASDLFLIAHQAASVGFLSNTSNNENAGNVLMSLQSTTNPELAGIVGNMNGASTIAELNAVLEAVQPAADAAQVADTTQFVQRSMDQVSDRLNLIRHYNDKGQLMTASLRESDDAIPAASGLQAWAVSFGDADNATQDHGLGGLKNNSFFGGAGTYARQEERDGIKGFRSTSGGAIIGIDTGRSFNDKTFGLALSYQHSDITSFNANHSETNIDGVMMLAYASKQFKGGTYVDLQASYAQNQNDTKRHDVGGTPGLTAKGDFTSREMGLRSAAGHDMFYGDYLFAPKLSVDWLHYTADDYTETGAGGANLNVATRSLDLVELGGDLRVQRSVKTDDGAIITPEVHAGYYYNLTGDPLQKTASFTGGGAAFTTQSPDPARSRINGGFGVTYHGSDNWDYSLSYDINVKSDYQEHSLIAKAAWKF